MRSILVGALALGLVGCSSLPADGPSTKAVEKGSAPDAKQGYLLVDLTYARTETIRQNPPRVLATLSGADAASRLDLIGEGDILRVSVFEPTSVPVSTSSKDGNTGGATQVYDHLAVDSSGDITIPFAGRVRVQGLTPSAAGRAVQQALRGRLINPQALVTVETSNSNAVVVLGDVKKGGRYPLTPNGDRLLDVVAAAGGADKSQWDCEIIVVRQGQTATAPFASVLTDPGENVRLAPGDQVRIVYKPRHFNAFGALGKVQQLNIEDESLSLAGALARIGGLDTEAADASSVFLFRFERPEVARAMGLTIPEGMVRVPIVYRLNLKAPEGFFIAQQMDVRPDDLIYAPRAETAELRKFLALASSLSQVAYDFAVIRVVS